MDTTSHSNAQREMIFGFIEKQLQLKLKKLEKLREKNDQNIEYIREKIDIFSQQLAVEDVYSSPSKGQTLSDKIRSYCKDIRQGNVPNEENLEQNQNDDEDVRKHTRNPSLIESVKAVKSYRSNQGVNINVDTNREKPDINLPSFDYLPSGTETRSTSAKSTRYLNPEKPQSGEKKPKAMKANELEKAEGSETKKTSKKTSKARENLTLVATASAGRMNSRSTKPKEDSARDEKPGKSAKVSNKEQVQNRNTTPIKTAQVSRKTSDIAHHEDTDNISESGVSDNGKFKPIRAQKTQATPEITKPVRRLGKMPSEVKLFRREDTGKKADKPSDSQRTKVKHKTANDKISFSPTASSDTTVSNENNKKATAARSKTPTRQMTLTNASPVKPDQSPLRRSATPNRVKDDLNQNSPSRTSEKRNTSPKPRSKAEKAIEQPDVKTEEALEEGPRKSQRPKRKNPAESETPSFSDAKETRFKSQNFKNEIQAKNEKTVTNKVAGTGTGRDPLISLMQGDERWDKNILSIDLKEMEQENLLASLDHIEDKLQYKEFREEIAEEERRRQFSIAEAEAWKEEGSPYRRVRGISFKLTNKKKNLELNIEDIERENTERMKLESEALSDQEEEKEKEVAEPHKKEGKNAKALKIEVGGKVHNSENPFESDNSPIARKNEDKETFSDQEEEDNGIIETNPGNETEIDLNTQRNAEEEGNNEDEDENVNEPLETNNEPLETNNEEYLDPNDQVSPAHGVEEENMEMTEESAREKDYGSVKKFWTEHETAVDMRKKSASVTQNIQIQKGKVAQQEEEIQHKEQENESSPNKMQENEENASVNSHPDHKLETQGEGLVESTTD